MPPEKLPARNIPILPRVHPCLILSPLMRPHPLHRLLLLLPLALAAAVSLRAQSTVPAVSAPIAPQSFPPGGAAAQLDLRNHFALPGVTGPLVQFDTVLGRFNVELFSNNAPAHVANFLTYTNSGAYNNTIVHRINGLGTASTAIVQGGGFVPTLPPGSITRLSPVALEYMLPNTRGTLAAARTSEINSATSEWFINTQDNSTVLGPTNGGGYSVFGRVLGTGMSVVDAIGQFPAFNLQGTIFSEIPLRNIVAGQNQVLVENYIIVNSIRSVAVHPATSGDPTVLNYTVTNTGPAIVSTALAGSTLTLTPLANGTTSVTVRATDTNGNAAEATFAVAVSATAPVITRQPVSQTIAAGTTVAFNVTAAGAAGFQWHRNGVALPGANSATLLVANTNAADAGSYTCVASNAAGATTSAAATLTVVNVPASSVGRLINLSILTTAGSGAKALTMGATVGGAGTTGALPLVIRAVGPTLTEFGIPLESVLVDPMMALNAANVPTPLATNDDWGGGPVLTAAFAGVGAFPLPSDSPDSALLYSAAVPPGTATAGYTVTVTGNADASGTAIAEIYDAAGATRAPTTPRLINLSTLTAIDAGGELAVGFVLQPGNTARTVLVRAAGPTLAATFGIDGVMADPTLELYNNNTGLKLAENDNWAADPALAAAFSAVGAFQFASEATTDAALVITLPDGDYSARVRGADGGGGTAIVEVYEIP